MNDQQPELQAFQRQMLTDAAFRQGYDTAIKHVVAYMLHSSFDSQRMWEKHRDTNPFVAEYWRGSMNDMQIVAGTIEGRDDSREFAEWVEGEIHRGE